VFIDLTWINYRSQASRARLIFYKVNKEDAMLYTIAIILLVLWLLGLVTSYTIGGFIHILIVVAIVMVLIRLITGRAP